MTADIVDIVDQLVMTHLQQACSDGESVHSRAADEIVRLRADMAQMKKHVNAWTNTALDFDPAARFSTRPEPSACTSSPWSPPWIRR